MADLFTVMVIVTNVIALLVSVIALGIVLKQYLKYQMKILLLIALPVFLIGTSMFLRVIPIFVTDVSSSQLLLIGIFFTISLNLAFTSIIIFFDYFSGIRSDQKIMFAGSSNTAIMTLALAAFMMKQHEIIFFTFEYDSSTVILGQNHQV